jgi:hypothetical protein
MPADAFDFDFRRDGACIDNQLPGDIYNPINAGHIFERSIFRLRRSSYVDFVIP